VSEEVLLTKNISDDLQISVQSVVQIKHQLINHATLILVLHEIDYGTFIQQSRKVKGFVYFEHNK
jgi:hypothetical protein